MPAGNECTFVSLRGILMVSPHEEKCENNTLKVNITNGWLMISCYSPKGQGIFFYSFMTLAQPLLKEHCIFRVTYFRLLPLLNFLKIIAHTLHLHLYVVVGGGGF